MTNFNLVSFTIFFTLLCLGAAIYRGLYFGIFNPIIFCLSKTYRDSILLNLFLGYVANFSATLKTLSVENIKWATNNP